MSEPKTAIITGAGSGIGRDTAVLLAEAGYHVTLVARTESALHETAHMIHEEFDGRWDALVVPTDLTDPDAIRAMVDQTLERFGRIDALANVAGSAPLGPIHEIDHDAWRACVDTNLTSVVLTTAAVWPIFQQQKQGVIVNVSSMSSIDPFPGFAMYAAAKIGVNMFTLCTAREGKRYGVRAVAVAPGAVETAMLRQNFNEKVIPGDKTLDPAIVAGVIRDCIVGDRDFKPGETIVLESP